MLKLERIMTIAEEHARHCCGPGETSGEIHNIQVISVAIQEALAENDDENKFIPLNGKTVSERLKRVDPYAKSRGTFGGSETGGAI